MRSGEGSTMTNFVVSPNIVRVIKSRRLRWAGHVVSMEEDRSSFKMLTVTSAGKRHLGRPRRRWEDHIRMDQELAINTKNWVDSAHGTDFGGPV